VERDLVERDLAWDGCRNVRDLGALPLEGGGTTVWGRVVRADNPARLTPAGWEALHAHGVRTVVLLRTVGTDDPEPVPARVPTDVGLVRVFVEDATDAEFRRRCIDTGFWATPLEWPEMLRSWPDRCASVVAAVAQAPPGGVVLSCGIGRDRTGLASFLLLALAGVPAAVIADDWSRSLTRLAGDPLGDAMSPMPILEREGATPRKAVEVALAAGVEARLLAGGLSRADLAAARSRMTA
jgi:hypothetical protein